MFFNPKSNESINTCLIDRFIVHDVKFLQNFEHAQYSFSNESFDLAASGLI